MSIQIKATTNEEAARKVLDTLKKRLLNLKPAMEIIGETVQASILKNFEAGGRPKRWARLSPVTIEERRKQGKWPGKILQRTGALRNVFYKASKKDVTLTANAPYAAIQHFGAKKGQFGIITVQIKEHTRKLKSGKTSRVSPHKRRMAIPWGDIPARPFMLVQDEDWDDIADQLKKVLLGALQRA